MKEQLRSDTIFYPSSFYALLDMMQLNRLPSKGKTFRSF